MCYIYPDPLWPCPTPWFPDPWRNRLPTVPFHPVPTPEERELDRLREIERRIDEKIDQQRRAERARAEADILRERLRRKGYPEKSSRLPSVDDVLEAVKRQRR